MDEKILCPTCEKDDQIQKITAIRSAGSTYGSGGATSGIAYLLAPPAKPRKGSTSATNDLIWLIVASGFLGVPACLFLSIGGDGGIETTGVILIIILGLVAVRFAYRANNVHPKEAEKVEKEYKPKLDAWNSATAKYRRSYYCSRDDLVFDPKGGSCAPQNLQAFLYRESDSAS